jgi:hypothetical protein
MTPREQLESDISTLLRRLDALGSEPQDPAHAQARGAELASADASLDMTVRALRALPHD